MKNTKRRTWMLWAVAALVLGFLGLWLNGPSGRDGTLGVPFESEPTVAVPATVGLDGARLNSSKALARMHRAPGSSVSAATVAETEPLELSGSVVAGRMSLPVPNALVKLMCAETMLAESQCDSLGSFVVLWKGEAALLEDDRTHWTVTSEHYGVGATLPFFPDDRTPSLMVDAQFKVTGQIQTPFVDRWPRATIFLVHGAGGADSSRRASTVAEKGGAFQMSLPTSQLKASMVVVFEDRFSEPHRVSFKPSRLDWNMGEVELSPGAVLKGQVDSQLDETYRGKHVTAYLDEYGSEWESLPHSSGRMVDGQLCLEGRNAPIAEDGSFVIRGLARRRYKVCVSVPGVLFPRAGAEQEKQMRVVDMRTRTADSEPLQLQDWWSIVLLDLRTPAGGELPSEVYVHGTVKPVDVQLATLRVDAAKNSCWFPVVAESPQSVILKFAGSHGDLLMQYGSLKPQELHEISVLLEPDGIARWDLAVHLAGPDGGNVSRKQEQGMAVRVAAYHKDSKARWLPLRSAKLRPKGDHWSIEGLKRGSYRFQFEARSHRNPDLYLPVLEASVEIEEEVPSPIRLEFQQGGKVRVRLTDPGGRPAQNLRAEVLRPNRQFPIEKFWTPQHAADPGRGNWFQASGNETGIVNGIPSLPPGRYLVRAQTNQGESVALEQEIEVRAGEVTSLILICGVD